MRQNPRAFSGPGALEPWLSPFHARQNRVLFPSVIAPWLKRAVWLLVIYGILYVLISPLPELEAALLGKSAIIFFVLVIYALAGWLPVAIAGSRFSRMDSSSQTDFLTRICVRLC